MVFFFVFFSGCCTCTESSPALESKLDCSDVRRSAKLCLSALLDPTFPVITVLVPFTFDRSPKEKGSYKFRTAPSNMSIEDATRVLEAFKNFV